MAWPQCGQAIWTNPARPKLETDEYFQLTVCPIQPCCQHSQVIHCSHSRHFSTTIRILFQMQTIFSSNISASIKHSHWSLIFYCFELMPLDSVLFSVRDNFWQQLLIHLLVFILAILICFVRINILHGPLILLGILNRIDHLIQKLLLFALVLRSPPGTDSNRMCATAIN